MLSLFRFHVSLYSGLRIEDPDDLDFIYICMMYENLLIFFTLYIMSRIQQGIAQEHPVSRSASILFPEIDQCQLGMDFAKTLPTKC